MTSKKHRSFARWPLATAALAVLALANPSANAAPVWNVNIGTELTASDNFIGAAPENTVPNSFWNSVTTANPTAMALADSTGTASPVTLTLTGSIGHTNGGWAAVSGLEIFSQWIKEPTNSIPFGMTIGGLNSSKTYDLIVYSDWYWKGNATFPVSQTAGTGLTGTTTLDQISTGTNGAVPALVQDTDPAPNTNIEGNWIRITGLTPNGSGSLGFSMGGTNAAFSGFQLIEISGGAPDTTPPTPSPMTWLNAPAAGGSSSITMTATTASDASGVEYFFTETTGNPGSTNSGWQNSPIYTDTGLTANTLYTYTVTARDKSAAQNPTAASAAASVTTSMVSQNLTVWNVNIGDQLTAGDNFVGAAAENTQNSTWNSVTSVPQTAMALQDSTGSSAAGVTFDITGTNVGNQDLNSGGEIFHSWIGGLGATANMTLKGLSITHSYDLIIYSDWWWKDGNSYPVSQTIGTGLTGTIYLNRILSGTYGTVPALTEDTNPADVTTGAGNVGNWYRIRGLVPESNGQLGFLLGDGANAPFNGFQLVQAGVLPPRADMVTFGLPGNPAVISGTNITLTVPYATSVTSLSPTFTLAPGATCVPVSGTVRNFTSSQTYTVTSSDSLVTKSYTATVVIAPPLPQFTLTAPANWDGRQTITVQPNISNLALLQANNGTNFNYQWSVSGVAVTHEITPGVLTLTRSQGSGPLVVTLILDNGGFGVTNSTTITVQEPATDPWVNRTPGAMEKPVTGQFFARNPDTGLGTIYYNGTQGGSPAGGVFLKVYTTDTGDVLYATHRQSLVGGNYAFSAPILAGKTTYKVVYGTTNVSNVDTIVATVSDLVCGDAYIIEGQSNAFATDNSAPRDDTTSPWIRTYSTSGTWSRARSKASDPLWPTNIGFWGMDLALQIVATHQMPVCIINGAVGGTRVDEHQANPADHTVGEGSYDIYANLLNRVLGANLTHGIRGIFWHQGESDCSNFGPISAFDYTTYQQNFLDMSSAWKQDYPNFQKYIIFQVMPKPCGIGPKGDQLREALRTLPFLYSKMSILNTLDNAGYEGCHFSKAGYEAMADRMLPVVSRDFYGVVPGAAVTAPNLKRAYFTSSARTAIALEFDQAMSWSSFSLPNYYLDKVANRVTSGSASGNVVTLQLASAAAANATLDYLEDDFWDSNESVSSLLYGTNAIPALTFADVAIGMLTPYDTWSNRTFANDFTNKLPTADSDGDGKTNQEEFAFALDPTTGSSVNPITQQLAGGIFKYTRTSGSGLTYKVYYSTTLSSWTLDAAATQSPASAVAGVETVTVALAAAAPANGKLFVRVEATNAP